MEEAQKKVVVDFIKAFSCAYSVTKNLSLELGAEIDPVLLRSVVGFSSGISTMGDTCGVANGGVAVLGSRGGSGRPTVESFTGASTWPATSAERSSPERRSSASKSWRTAPRC